MKGSQTQLSITRAPNVAQDSQRRGRIINIVSETAGEPIFWIDVQHGKRYGKEGIVLKLIQCPFAALNPIRFYVDLCNDLDKDLFGEDKDLPERFCQIVRRQLSDPQLYPSQKTSGGTFLRFIGNPKKYVDGHICSVRGILTRKSEIQAFGVPEGENLGDFSVNASDREENYDDDFMIGFALGLAADSLDPHGMRLIRNDLSQLRLHNGHREITYDEKHTYRLVVTYAQQYLIGNYKHFLRQDEIGTRVPHRLTLPLEETRFEVPPLSQDEMEVPKPPPAVVPVPSSSSGQSPPATGMKNLTLTDRDSDSPKQVTGLEPHLIHKNPFSWSSRDYEDGDDLMAEEPRFSLDALTGAIAQRNQLRRERSPPVSPTDNPQEREVKYRKSY